MACGIQAAYLRFGSERARPFFDLLSRVQAADPGYVVDLGCGPGNLTAAAGRALARAPTCWAWTARRK